MSLSLSIFLSLKNPYTYRFCQWKMGGTYRKIPRQYLLACRTPPAENLSYFDVILGNLSMVLREQTPFHLTYQLPPNVSYADTGRKLREW